MVIKKPMDLSTLLTNIDEHKYVTVSEFMLDADLIWQNALEYNPDSDPMGENQLSPDGFEPPLLQDLIFFMYKTFVRSFTGGSSQVLSSTSSLSP